MDKSIGKVVDIRERTFKFSIKIAKLIPELPRNSVSIVIGNQLIRSGTSVGANVEEAQSSGSKKEFIHSMTIALKEARESKYWLRLIDGSILVENKNIFLLLTEVEEIVKILTTIIKNTKANSLK